MKRAFIIGVVGRGAKVFPKHVTKEQLDRLLRDIYSPVEFTLAESKELMRPKQPKVVS